MRRIILAVIAAVIAASALIIAAISGLFGLSLKNEVRPLEAVTLVVNLLIAFFLQRFYATRINDLRAEKNVLIDGVRETIRQLTEVSERTDTQVQKPSIDEADKTAILVGFRRVANAITDLEESVSMSHLESVKQFLPAIRSGSLALKVAATGGSFPSRGYSIEEGNSQEQIFRSLKTNCRRLIFTINSAEK